MTVLTIIFIIGYLLYVRMEKMGRVRKEKKYTEFLRPLNGEDLTTLISEAQVALRGFERKNSVAAMQNRAIKFRNTLKIGSEISFKEAGQVVTAPVTGITANKVQVSYKGKRKSISIVKLLPQ